LQNNAGSDCFFSPEACAGEKYSGKIADIWACAVTLYQMVFGKLPFNSANRIGLYE
jgi:serine/threonine protein kinase